jgi:AraC-like DNA-binding protein
MNLFKGLHIIFGLRRMALIAFACLSTGLYAQVTFVIDDVPKGTPPGDSIFICGTFNNWSTDPKFLLHKRLDGKFAITLEYDSAFEYKFHRGDWFRVETSSRNQYMANRKYSPAEGSTVHISVANWQDLGGAKPFEIVSFYFFALVFLALTAAYFLLQIRNRKKARTKRVIILLVFLALILLGRVVIEVISLPWQFQLGLLGDISCLIAGPLWYYTMSSAVKKDKFKQIHFLPGALMLLLFFVRYFNPPFLSFLTQPVSKNFLIWDDIFTYAFATSSLSFYLILILQLWPQIKAKTDLQPAELNFFRALLFFGAAFVVVVVLRILVLTGDKESNLLFYNRNLLIAGASIAVLLICYYVFTFEEVFRVTQPVFKKTDDLESLKNTLHLAMKEKRVFTNPHLTLNELSDTVKIKPHVLSKIINDYYHQNFRDFVNSYRIEEFIELANKGASKRFTFLALAYEVGFNSKSTFNVAFKKIMNVTPREYFMAKRAKSLKNKDVTSTAL